MTRNAMTSPLATGAAGLSQSYQIAEKDVQFIRTLGQGASGLVQKAFWPAKAEFVAVKKISILEREKRHQLMNDIKALCNTPDTPGLIRFKGAYHSADKGQIAVALEYMDGGSLADVLEKVGHISEPVLAAMTKSVLQGLAYLHANHTVHRDIKPANILMSTSGEPKISDFGISAFVDNTIAQCCTFLGTVTYMSPERINGQPYAFPADIWALGLALVECATGRYPYDASGGTMQLMIALLEEECPLPPEKNEKTDGNGENSDDKGEITLSGTFRDFVTKCMAKDPMRRPIAEELLRHPFITQAPPVDLRAFMKCMYNRKEKVEDAVSIVISKFYNNLAFNWSDEDSIAAFYAPESFLAFGPSEAPDSALQKIKGRYTVAQHFHTMMTHLVGDVAFDFHKQQHKHRVSTRASPPPGDEGEVIITHRVVIRDEGPRLDGSTSDVLGVYDETMVVRLRDVDALVPGVGCYIKAQQLRWVQALVPRKIGKEQNSNNNLATPPKCRQQ
jgi:serine/threonine protein kinase